MSSTKFSMYLNLGVAVLQICSIVIFGAWPNIFLFAFSYTLFWLLFREYRREKAKEWYASILATQSRAQFPQRMKNCLGLCNSTDDYLPIAQIQFSPPLTSTFTGQLICRLCGRVE